MTVNSQVNKITIKFIFSLIGAIAFSASFAIVAKAYWILWALIPLIVVFSNMWFLNATISVKCSKCGSTYGNYIGFGMLPIIPDVCTKCGTKRNVA